jgi:heat shock protein HtpX
MLGQAFGLYSHIRNNKVRSWFLIGGLFFLAYLITFGLVLLFAEPGGSRYAGAPERDWWGAFLRVMPVATIVTLVWVFIGFKFNVALIGLMSGARGISRAENPRLYQLLENLCISRGMTTPRLAILESDALNAFASGVTESQFTITVTSGLIASLDEAEIEVVLAHELTHIRNGDVRLMIIAVVVVGAISLLCQFLAFLLRAVSSSRKKESNIGLMFLLLIGLLLLLIAWLLAVVIKLSLSRTREYLADAGAVELTKNPDAMISALLKISGRDTIQDMPSGLMAMCLANDSAGFFSNLFSTHPSIERRVQALITLAGGRLPQNNPRRPSSRRDPTTPPQNNPRRPLPWQDPAALPPLAPQPPLPWQDPATPLPLAPQPPLPQQDPATPSQSRPRRPLPWQDPATLPPLKPRGPWGGGRRP